MPEYTKDLAALHSAWSNCAGCELSVRRLEVGGPTVFGVGSSRGIMFVGEGPGRTEEEKGRPFVGVSGKLLRRAIRRMKLTRIFITNIVGCRCCEQRRDELNRPMYETRWLNGVRVNSGVPLMEDKTPPIPCINACLPRLHEEIQIVDPLLIVALGATAARAVTGQHNLSITEKRGTIIDVKIPGRWVEQVLTEKKGVWLHKVRGQYVQPVRKHQVGYSVLPTYHPSFIHRNSGDGRPGNPTERFVEDLALAKHSYEKYLYEIYKIPLSEHEPADDSIDIHDENEVGYESDERSEESTAPAVPRGYGL